MQDFSFSTLKGDDFTLWLNAVTTTYKSLDNEKRNFILKHLVSNSEPNQLNFLGAHIPTLSCRDFISYLPIELVSTILKHLTGRQLLRLCQVCKGWKDRIGSLTDLWQVKAFEVGVNVQAISSKYPVVERARVFRTTYCLTEQFFSSFKRRKVRLERVPNADIREFEDDDADFCLNEDSIVIGDSPSGIAKIFSLPEWSLKGIIQTIGSFKAFLLYKNSQLFISNSGAVVTSCNFDLSMVTDEQREEDSDSDGENDANGIPKKHTFRGHTSSVLGVDIMETMGDTYVITGSWDKTVKVWIVHSSQVASELFMTLDNAHIGKVSEVFFLPSIEDGVLRFISCGTKCMFVWSIDVQTRRVQSAHVDVPEGVASFYFDITKPEQTFISVWDFDEKQSALRSYQLCHETVGIELGQEWDVFVYGFKATVLGTGMRLAFLMCSISLQDFLLFDLVSGHNLMMFTTSTRFNRLPVRMYETSWLDGFTFDKDDTMPTLIGSINGGYDLAMAMLKFDFPIRSNGAGEMDME